MENLELYINVAERYDRDQIVGAPLTNTLLKILMNLMNPEEAEIALKLPFQNVSLSQAGDLFPEKGDRIEALLDGMAEKGTVFRDSKPGREKRYRLLPSLVGWQETPFWHGRETEQAKILSPLFKEYHKEAFAAEMARGMPLMRVIPIETSLSSGSEILPFDEIKPLVDQASYRAVGHCPCRVTARLRGEACDHSTENCLHFGSMGRYMVEHNLARVISREETMKILKAADEEGLVHIINNINGHLDTICNCCKCCCSFLTPTREKWGLDMLSYSNYLATVDGEACIGCGICEERCPVGAVKVADEVAGVDEALCLGCGACTPTCTTEAIRLNLRTEIKPPPAAEDFFKARLK